MFQATSNRVTRCGPSEYGGSNTPAAIAVKVER